MPSEFTFVPIAAPIPAKLLQTFRADAGWTDEDEAALAAALMPGSRVEWVVAKRGQKTVALARLELAPPQFCYLSELIVLGGWRGRGLGAWFMEQIERHCLERGIPRVILRPLGTSRGFYEKLRFVDDPLAAGFLKKDIQPLRRRPGGFAGLPF